MKHPVREALRLPPGPVRLASLDTRSNAAVARAGGHLRGAGRRLARLQDRLFAEAAAGGHRRILLVLQGMDTAGKAGVTNHVAGVIEPIAVRYTAFKKPTAEELAHDFLWRVRRRLPEPGVVGVFDRSHYEDVLVPLVHGTIAHDELERRYRAIEQFEAELVEDGTTLLKCFLHVSYDTQRERLLARLDDPSKRWKFSEDDLRDRARWSDYAAAYEAMLQRCNSRHAPWYVIPSDDKPYRNWLVAQLLTHTLAELDPRYPEPTLDLARLRERLAPPG